MWILGFDAKTPPPSKGNDKKGGSKSRLPTTPEDEELKDTADTEQLLGRPGAGAAVVQSDVPNWGARKPPRVPARHESDDDDVSPMNSDLVRVEGWGGVECWVELSTVEGQEEDDTAHS